MKALFEINGPSCRIGWVVQGRTCGEGQLRGLNGGDHGHCNGVRGEHRVQCPISGSPMRRTQGAAERKGCPETPGRTKTSCSDGVGAGCSFGAPDNTPIWRKAISDVDPGSISGTISGTLPPLSPGAGARFWLRGPLRHRVVGPSVTASKESHGGGGAPRDIGIGFDNPGKRKTQDVTLPSPGRLSGAADAGGTEGVRKR
jgi:hypothetical protein